MKGLGTGVSGVAGWNRLPPCSPERGSISNEKELCSLPSLCWGLSRNGVKNYSKGPCVTFLE